MVRGYLAVYAELLAGDHRPAQREVGPACAS
jgi:hypothetical protein